MSGKQIGADCQFEIDGTVRVRRIYTGGGWMPVSQGRQWHDHLGRHVLIVPPDGPALEIRLRPDTMTWEQLPAGGGRETKVV